MSDIISISQQIEAKIKEIDKVRSVLIERSDDRDNAEANYTKEYAMVLIGLKNSKEYELDGEKIKDPPAASVKEIAKGICWLKKLEYDKAESLLKIAFKNLEAVQSQLTAYQSINKHLD
jgi:hypothetical protein